MTEAGLLDRARSALASRYDVVRQIERGGMGVVYLARDTRHDRDVAIKVLRPEVAASLGAERFLQEIQLEARLQHPHILPLYDSGEADGLLYYVMPYVEGEALRARLEREGQLPLDDALRLAGDLAAALGYAHEHGVVHRDIKPENVLLSDGQAVLADFGIARAVRVAGSHRITASGMAVGTPEYMSPEQASGLDPIDGRSDIYALGCLTFEMLAGTPPFTGPTHQAIVARHLQQPPPPLRDLRSVPAHVETAITRALAKAPADRYQTAPDFAAALNAPLVPALPWRRLAIAAALLVAAGAGLYSWIGGGAPALDEDRYLYVALPAAGPGAQAASHHQIDYQFEHALRMVPGIELQDSPRVADCRLRAGAGGFGLDQALACCRTSGARWLIALQRVPRGDSMEVQATVYDASRRRSVRQEYGWLPGDDLGREVGRFVERLFGLAHGAISPGGTQVTAAAREYAAGRTALASWQLGDAATRFEAAVGLDPDYAHAWLWLAQARMWAREPVATWVGAARNAAGRAPALPDSTARVAAHALVELGEGRYPSACDAFEQMVALDSLNFAAWFGLGECRAGDRVVVRDPTSPTGWRFRSSHHAAVAAYRRALQLTPSFIFAFAARLADVLYVESSWTRHGRAEAPDTGLFAAFLERDGDTVRFLPRRDREARSTVLPASHTVAVAGERGVLSAIMREWAEAFPDSSRPHRELGTASERRGQLEGTGGDEPSALPSMRRARQTARTAEDSLAAAVSEVRILLKLGRFDAAAALADSTLARWSAPGARFAERLSALAALLGRGHESARLARNAASLHLDDRAGRFAGLSGAVLQTWKALESFAALGGYADSLRVLSGRLDAMLPPGGPWECRIRWSVLSLAWPVLRRSTDNAGCWGPNPRLQAQHALSRGDLAAARNRLAEVRELRRALVPPGEVAAYVIYHDAWLALQAADTVGALDQLDGLLNALPTLRTDALATPPQAAGLVRVMALRADVAAARGDRVTAQRWAQPVVILWARTDPDAQALVRRMQGYLTG